MKASKIIHKDEDRIKVDFPFNQEIALKIRQIPDARWSKTHRAWHIPYRMESYNQLVATFPDIEIPPFQTTEKVFPDIEAPKIEIVEKVVPIPEAQSLSIKNEIVIEISGKHLLLKMPKNDTDIQFIRTFKFVRWDNANFKWVVPNYGKNLELIKNYFNTRITRIDTRIPELPKAIVGFAVAEMTTELPKIDSESLQEIERFKQWMEQKRYSDSTVKTYVGAITVFLRFIKPKISAEATNIDMQRFVYQYMIPRKLSFSYQNQAVNAAKLFFKTIKDSLLITEKLVRPRREHKLPNVLSKEEVAIILQSLKNEKHRTALSMIYACGLRRGELLNLKPENVDSKRHFLIIKKAKGKKDRLVPISDKVISMLRKYYKMYKPKTWLFEGQFPGKPVFRNQYSGNIKKCLA